MNFGASTFLFISSTHSHMSLLLRNRNVMLLHGEQFGGQNLILLYGQLVAATLYRVRT